MQRYFVEEKYVNETSIRIVGDDVHHIARVMRMSAGDHIYCCVNGKQPYVQLMKLPVNLFIRLL